MEKGKLNYYEKINKSTLSTACGASHSFYLLTIMINSDVNISRIRSIPACPFILVSFAKVKWRGGIYPYILPLHFV